MGEVAAAAAEQTAGPGLYIHIPFCVRKCLYCDFFSEPTSSDPLARRITQQHAQPSFLDALEQELAWLPDDAVPDTIFIGGGTPTELTDDDFSRLLFIIEQQLDTSRVREWSCEANPGTLTADKVERIAASPINRISLGVQSFNDQTLEFLGRIHTAEEAEAGMRLLRAAGIRNINMDLIFGVPGQTIDQLHHDLDRLTACEPEHAALYCLMYEDGTPLTSLKNKGYITPQRDDICREQYDLICDRLHQGGFQQYELSNFAKPGFACRHNLKYWTGQPYFGCGPSAHSYVNGRRESNISNTSAYISLISRQSRPVTSIERLTGADRARELFVFALRRTEGLSAQECLALTGMSLDELLHGRDYLLNEGLLSWQEERLQLAADARFISDGVFSALL